MRKKTSKKRLDAEERELLESFNKGEWKTVDLPEKELMLAKKAAKNYIKKDSRINIRLSSTDLTRLKRLAAREGLPYQTLIASILHKYVAQNLSNAA